MKKSLFALLVVCVYQISNASQINLSMRGYFHSCGYYSNTTADFHVEYLNESIPWGSKVFLDYGLSQLDVADPGKKREWQKKASVELTAVGPYKWSGNAQTVTHNRSSPEMYDHLAFVLRIVTGDNSWVDLGSPKSWSFYQAKIPYINVCLKDNLEQIPFVSLPFVVIER
jgi:hypothetical protein